MLIRFSSTKTESITMFGDVAAQLIAQLGAGHAVPGAIRAEDIPAAVRRLRAAVGTSATAPPDDARSAGARGDDRDAEPPVALATRAAPLIELLDRAAAAGVAVMWERG
jgi:hypothetical protein